MWFHMEVLLQQYLHTQSMARMWLLFAISLGLGVSEWKSRSYDDLQSH